MNFGFAFDFDGTLVNSIDVVWKVQDVILDNYDIKKTKELENKIELKINEILKQENRKVGRPIMMAIFKLLGLNFFQRIRALLLARRVFAEEAPKISLIDGTERVLSLLDEEEIPYLIVTTSSNEEVADRLEHKYPRLYEHLKDKIIARDDVKKRKPHPESIEKAGKMLGLSPKNVVVVGDMEADIKLGKSVDGVTVGVLTGFLNQRQMKNIGADFIIDTIADLPDILSDIKQKFN